MLLRVSDYEKAAQNILPAWVAGYIYGAAEEGSTYQENFEAIKRYLLKPRMLRNVSNIDTTTTILGYPLSFPVCSSPTACHTLAHASAEFGSAKGVTDSGLAFTVSTYSSVLIEDIPKSCQTDSTIFYNVYIFKDREMVRRLVRTVESSGYRALVVTVDSPCPGPGIGKYGEITSAQILRTPYTHPNFVPKEVQYTIHQHQYCLDMFDPSVTWKDVAWLKSITSLPVIAKGVLCAEDAELALEAGVSGIIVSNHGGRQLGGTTGTMDVLREVVLAVRGRCEVYVDGGFRTGTDVLKALALGARVVFIGRPVLYALAHGGSKSVTEMLDILRGEFTAAMAMSGCGKISDINRSLVRHRTELTDASAKL